MRSAVRKKAPPRPEPRRRTGGRSARVVRDVLAATLDELAAGGYARLSVEAIADRAGVSRATVYRRWPTKPELVRAAVSSLAMERPPPPDTGSMRRDLTELLGKRMGQQSPRNLALMRAFMSEVGNPEVVALSRAIGVQHQAGLVTIVQRGIERGELPRGSDPLRVIEPILATFFMRMSMFGQVPEPRNVAAIVDLVVDGARSGAAIPARRP